MRMTHRPISGFLALLAVCSLAACHGAGKSVVPKATATPTLAPGCKVLTPQSGGSTYTLTSNPTGLSVQRIDASSTTCVYFFGTTQASDTPQTAPHQWQYVFTPSVASPYTVPVAQTLNGNHTIFYNQAGDSSGTLNLSSLQSVARRTGSSPRRAAGNTPAAQRQPPDLLQPGRRLERPPEPQLAAVGRAPHRLVAAARDGNHPRHPALQRRGRRRRPGARALSQRRHDDADACARFADRARGGRDGGSRADDGVGRVRTVRPRPRGQRRDGVRGDHAVAERRARRLPGPQAVPAHEAADDGERPAHVGRQSSRSMVPDRRRLPERVVVHARHRHQARRDRHRGDR